MNKSITLPAIILQEGREKALNRRHPWLFSNAIDKVLNTPNRGDTVEVLSSKGQWLARAAYSPSSQIRARIWTYDQAEQIDLAFFIRKIERAWQLRLSLFNPSQTDGLRVIAAESDDLPGITIDKYQTVLVVQLLSAGADAKRTLIVKALQHVFPEHSIFERSDVDVRKKEGLPLVTGWLYAAQTHGEVFIKEHGMQLLVDVIQGHKTGFYLDQRASRAAVRRFAQDAEILNCFSYTGTFAVAALAGGAKHVTNVDMSELALATATRNAELNQLDLSKITNIKADVFKLLRQYQEQGKMFDLIILDPPKFVENRSQLNSACRGYKDINRLAMQLVKPGGLLFTFSCSGLMEEGLFHKVVADAALDAQRNCLFIERLQQDSDHPVASFFPEGHYLKGLICKIY
ncbi:class I SAM-dependent methyltransferase [Alishewanella tabrizica]|uniref:Ribosomal RNA large subunit methyltransferase I n=1 Tax=Alishewanella tabrizica TaxID=671278 RepID=A0ABQ2WJM2_9ALTE|nr:class I SAM-dependent methyltransferase [Alishewanella tabrizica]GGW58261.1 ribosomal RNA large subunit methyltransferase I [Alishewanella tabrizica]